MAASHQNSRAWFRGQISQTLFPLNAKGVTGKILQATTISGACGQRQNSIGIGFKSNFTTKINYFWS
jgi:hypothetical protein